MKNNGRGKITIVKAIARANGFHSTIIDDIGVNIQRKIKKQEKLRITTLGGRKETSSNLATLSS